MSAPAGNKYALGNAGGRPTGYRRRYCDLIVELGARGKSQIEISATLDIPRSTMDRWGKRHKEFRAALTRAKEAEMVWWEKIGRENLYSRTFNATVWIKSMEARFPYKYTSRQKCILTGKNGEAIEVAGAKSLAEELVLEVRAGSFRKYPRAKG